MLFEVNDLFPDSGAHLNNLSARAQVAPGAGALIAGFVVSGAAPQKVLLRGIGPGFTSHGLTGVLVDPRLDLYRGGTLIESNSDWSGTAALAEAFTAAAAFGLPDAASRDAALIVTRTPGVYTTILSSAAETGIAMVEIYELP